MAKTQTQRTREHRARVSRKARAFDKLIADLKGVATAEPPDYLVMHLVGKVVEAAERDAETAQNGGA